MKNFIRRLPVKIICFILCVITLCASVLSVIGAIFLLNENFYIDTPEKIFADETYYELAYNAEQAVYYLAQGKDVPDSIGNPQKSNLRFDVTDSTGTLTFTNRVANGEGLKVKGDIFYTFNVSVYSYEGVVYAGVLSRFDDSGEGEIWRVSIGVSDELAAHDVFAFKWELISTAHNLRYAVIPLGAVSFLSFIVLFIVLMCASGRRVGDEEAHGGLLNAVPFDKMLAASFVLFLLGAMLLDELSHLNTESTVALVAFLSFIGVCILLGLCMSASARLKQGTLLKNTVVWRLICSAWRIAKWLWKHIKRFAKRLWALVLNFPLIWRTVCLLAAVFAVDFIMLFFMSCHEDGLSVFLLLAKTAVLGFLAMFSALYMRKLQKGGEALAKGDLDYTVDTEKMYYDFKKHGENLNRISSGMAVAVEERLHSERMKAELITNVSHDIKTPLTSIINYATLIAESECGDEKHGEYSEVLVRKSEHLKRLLEDLVEISKANSGTLEVALLPCDAGVLLSQAAGEFEQKCADSGLELITVNGAKNVRIMADSRRIWRVFENLMNNAVKYSLPHSRVYLSLETTDNEVKFVFRNTSRDPLNITPDELTERFVRGDASRSSEGSGLGLSIAKSLTELQNGKMEIFIDGDLFKVVLAFPKI